MLKMNFIPAPVKTFLSKRPLQWSPTDLSRETKEQFLKAQQTAYACAKEVSQLLREGMTEEQTTLLMETYLHDHHVSHFFHHSYAWFGPRTTFAGMFKPAHFLPTKRPIREGESFILDVAPIVEGVCVDIGATGILGNQRHPHYDTLLELRELIPLLFMKAQKVQDFYQQVNDWISERDFLNAHLLYPQGVLGHRLHRLHQWQQWGKLSEKMVIYGFGPQSLTSLLSRGIFSELINQHNAGDKRGLWAIEPHIATKDRQIGAKFEEILVCDGEKAWWLNSRPEFMLSKKGKEK
jgi:hypothetical protein